MSIEISTTLKIIKPHGGSPASNEKKKTLTITNAKINIIQNKSENFPIIYLILSSFTNEK